MLPVVEPDCELTTRRIVACSLLLIPISLVPQFVGMAGSVYAVAAVAAGMVLLWIGFRLRSEPTFARARQVLLASVLYLPVVLAAMVLDRRVL
jgi:protoheme IX farnesyltransferase